jgi:hypothetical protein
MSDVLVEVLFQAVGPIRKEAARMAEIYNGMMDAFRVAIYILAIMALIKYLEEG